MAQNRSPLFDPIPPQQPQAAPPVPPKNVPISPIASYVGEGNMILVWTMLAIVAFVAFVIFYLIYNPVPVPVSNSTVTQHKQPHRIDDPVKSIDAM